MLSATHRARASEAFAVGTSYISNRLLLHASILARTTMRVIAPIEVFAPFGVTVPGCAMKKTR